MDIEDFLRNNSFETGNIMVTLEAQERKESEPKAVWLNTAIEATDTVRHETKKNTAKQIIQLLIDYGHLGYEMRIVKKFEEVYGLKRQNNGRYTDLNALKITMEILKTPKKEAD